MDCKIQLYTGKDFSGESFIINDIGDFPVENEIKISSIKIKKGIQVTFEFESHCNCDTNGGVRYINNDCGDISKEYSCNNTCRISNILVRPNVDQVDENRIIVYQNPYLKGPFRIIGFGDYTALSLGLSEIASVQTSSFASLIFYENDNLTKEILYLETGAKGEDKFILSPIGRIHSGKAKSIRFAKIVPTADPQIIKPKRELRRRTN